MPTEFNHITVPSKNLETSITFYTSIGMELIEYEVGHLAHFENKEHEIIFTVYYNENRPEYEVTVYFEVSDLEELEIRFRESVLKTAPKTPWEGKELHLSDPDGNRLILYEKFSADSVPPWQQKKR